MLKLLLRYAALYYAGQVLLREQGALLGQITEPLLARVVGAEPVDQAEPEPAPMPEPPSETWERAPHVTEAAQLAEQVEPEPEPGDDADV